MTSAQLLVDAFSRVQEEVHAAVEGLSTEQLRYRPSKEANSIAWLIWHLTRVQDDHIAGVADLPQVWTEQDWYSRFDLPYEPAEHGYGHSSEQVERMRATAELLTGYYDATHEQTLEVVSKLVDEDFPRVVDSSYSPPVTLGVRLISVISDDLQHVGQAAFVRGLLP